MPQLRVFVSSTAYDLSMVRGQLRTFIQSLGHHAVMSEYSGILFDPTAHTHESCVQELATCDAVVLIIGSRWGSQARPEFLAGLDQEAIDDDSNILKEMLSSGKVSVTQLEALTAFKLGIPVFVFVERSVLAEARFFEANAELAAAGGLVFPATGDSEIARYIFSFLDYVNSRPTGNAVQEFAQIEDIQSHLRSQWSALMQRLLSATREAGREQGLVEALTERLDDMKAAILTSIESADVRNVAAGVLNFRLLCDLLNALATPRAHVVAESPGTFESLLEVAGVRNVVALRRPERAMAARVILVLVDRAIELRISDQRFWSMSRDWSDFAALSSDERTVIWDTLTRDRKSVGMAIRSVDVPPDILEYLGSRSVVDGDEWDFIRRDIDERLHPRIASEAKKQGDG